LKALKLIVLTNLWS